MGENGTEIKKQILHINIIIFTCFLCINILFSLFYPLRFNFAQYILHKQLTEPIQDAIYVKYSIVFSVLSGLILIYLVNFNYLNDKIKELYAKWISLPSINADNDKADKDNSIFLPDQINIILIFISCFLFFLFFQRYFSFEPLIHPEAQTFIQLQIKKESDVIKQCIPTIFNLDNFEYGFYRPRLMAFLIDYININALPILNKLLPFWSMRLIFTVISIILSIVAIYLLINYFFRKMPFGMKLFLSVFPIFFVSVQIGMGIFDRTSKFLVIPLCLFLLYYFLKYYKVNFEIKSTLRLFLSVFLIFLCTIYDEQLVLCILYFTFASISLSVIYKKLNSATIVFSASLFLYFLWHNIIGKYLFSVFTPHELFPHGHSYRSFLAIIIPDKLFDCIVLFCRLIINNHLIYIIIISLVLILVTKKKKFNTDILIIPCFVMILSFLLVCANALGHAPILDLPDMKYSNYLAPALFLFYIGLIYFIFKLLYNFQLNKIIVNLILLSFLVIVLLHQQNWQKYYNIHVSGIGHMAHINDVSEIDINTYNRIIALDNIIQENNISLKYFYLRWNFKWYQTRYEDEIR
jgi:hypothetical protein